MPNICPECGAVLSGDTTCQAIFDACLVQEFTDPGYGEVHMLTVACFMVQHGRYSDEGLTWIADRLRDNLEGGISAQQIRWAAAQETSQGKRTWKVTRRPDAPPLPKVAWSITIADIIPNPNDPGTFPDAARYCDLVRQWGRVTLQEMKPLVGRA